MNQSISLDCHVRVTTLVVTNRVSNLSKEVQNVVELAATKTSHVMIEIEVNLARKL